MKFKSKLSRRSFISYSFLGIVTTYIAYSTKKKDSFEVKNDIKINQDFKINTTLKEEIKVYNSKRKSSLIESLESSILDDLNNEKTLWVGKHLFTYAEIR
tara:strand:- start:48 stop:347 length:300 start_codon:yes stop_codon:yes gene_type:complete